MEQNHWSNKNGLLGSRILWQWKKSGKGKKGVYKQPVKVFRLGYHNKKKYVVINSCNPCIISKVVSVAAIRIHKPPCELFIYLNTNMFCAFLTVNITPIKCIICLHTAEFLLCKQMCPNIACIVYMQSKWRHWLTRKLFFFFSKTCQIFLQVTTHCLYQCPCGRMCVSLWVCTCFC